MNDKGIVLIITLWVLALLTIVAMHFSFFTRSGSTITRNFKEETEAYYLAMSAYEEALAYLITDKDYDVDFIDRDGNFRTDAERKPMTGIRKIKNATVHLRITDEESRFNINNLLVLNKYEIIRNLFGYTSVPEESMQELIDCLADWYDKDDLHRLLGAESEYYDSLGYRAKNNSLSVPGELLLIKGFNSEYYHGSEFAPPLNNLVTAWGEGININTASEDLLRVLGFSSSEIVSIISRRESQDGLRDIPRELSGMGLTRSFNFRIQASAFVAGSPQALRITSIVKRTLGPRGPELAILYWKEDFENSGT